jgi:hypothetical protein
MRETLGMRGTQALGDLQYQLARQAERSCFFEKQL